MSNCLPLVIKVAKKELIRVLLSDPLKIETFLPIKVILKHFDLVLLTMTLKYKKKTKKTIPKKNNSEWTLLKVQQDKRDSK